jgi:hypothetical protein
MACSLCYYWRLDEELPMDIAVVEAIRDRCIATAIEAYEDAGIRGLCAEGRWECAIEAMRNIKLGETGEE